LGARMSRAGARDKVLVREESHLRLIPVILCTDAVMFAPSASLYDVSLVEYITIYCII
jgi:hypothetical protein